MFGTEEILIVSVDAFRLRVTGLDVFTDSSVDLFHELTFVLALVSKVSEHVSGVTHSRGFPFESETGGKKLELSGLLALVTRAISAIRSTNF